MAKFGYRVIAIKILVLHFDNNTVLRLKLVATVKFGGCPIKTLMTKLKEQYGSGTILIKNAIGHTLPKKCNQS